MITSVFFDLDNTLYDQRIYFASGFKVVADYLCEKYSLEEDTVIKVLYSLLNDKGSLYTRLFDDLLDYFAIYDKKVIELLIKLFHEAPVDSLILYQDVRDVLPRLADKYVMGLITNGYSAMQRRKATALGLNKLLTIRIYTSDIGYPKPEPQGYICALDAASAKPHESLYVGDNPYVDFEGAKSIGMHTVRLLRGEFNKTIALEGLVDKEVRSFYEIEDLLAKA